MTPANRPPSRAFPLSIKLVLYFGLLCAILIAIGSVFFFNLRSIETLNAAERSSYVSETAVLRRVAKNLGLQQAEVFRQVVATNPEEMERHEPAIARLEETNASDLTEYGRRVDVKAEERLYAQVLEAQRAYSECTGQLLALSHGQRNAEATAFALTTQVPAYDRYQTALDELVGFEDAEGRGIAATTTGRIQQTRVAGNVLIGLAIVIALGTGAAVLRIVGTLRQDKKSLQTEVDEHERAEQALREGEARYRLLVEHSPDSILVVCNEKIVFVNPATVKLLGADRSGQLIGRSVSKILHPDEHAEVARRSREVAAGMQPPAAERRFLRLDGSTVEVESRVISFLYEGKPAVQVIVRDNTERKTAEKQLREAEEKYRSIFDNALEGIFQSTPDGVFISANPAFARMLGFASPEELIRERNDIKQQSYAEPAKRQEFKRLLEKNGAVNDFEFEVKRKDGSTIWLSENVRLVRDDAGNALYYEGSAQDITKRTRAELVLRESEEYLRLVIAASNDGIWEYDFLADALTWSDRVYEMFLLDRRSFTPTLDSFTALLHPDDRATFQKTVREQMTSGARYEAHIRILRGDGSYGHFLRRGRAVLDAAGKPTRMVGSFADLTSLLQAEQKLLEQADLLNLAQDAIIVRDMNDRIEFWNHGAEVLYGWTAEEARGRLSGDFLCYDEPVKMLAERTLLETGAWSGECRHFTKQGVLVVVRSRWTLVRDEHGKPKSKLIIATDMTEQKKIEEQFLRAQRLESIGTLASGVAHDLNNILVPIMMAAPVLRRNMDSAERERFLDIVESSAHRGADIIKQVLTFARGADGDRILLQPIYLLEEVSKIAGQTFPKSIALRTSYEENIRSLEADPTQLHQVLLNLCINARDAMPNGGELCLGAKNFDVDERYASTNPGATAGPHVMLQVTDTGTGIPKEVMGKIFDPFFTTKSLGHGTGLGLSTVAGIVKSYGGFIRVHSEPGRTSFKIFLPAKATFDSAALLQVDATVPRGNGQTILLIDDEPSIREVAEVILTSHGYKVLLAEDGPTALAIFARQMGHIAVVVTDLAMPGMDGLMLVDTLRRIEPGLKVIVSTGRADESHAAEITALGVDGCLTKPYTSRNMLLKLSHVLSSGMHAAA